jgi:hypothetical protein
MHEPAVVAIFIADNGGSILLARRKVVPEQCYNAERRVADRGQHSSGAPYITELKRPGDSSAHTLLKVIYYNHGSMQTGVYGVNLYTVQVGPGRLSVSTGKVTHYSLVLPAAAKLELF